MIFTLIRKECTQIYRSLIYWLYAACLILFFYSQLGGMNILEPPREGQEDYSAYGYKSDITDQEVMETGTGSLVWAYYYDHYETYPVGFAKNVYPSEEEKEEIAGIIYDLTGVKAEDLEEDIDRFFQQHDIRTTQYEIKVKEGVTYKQFLGEMKKVTRILGPGSGFTEENLRANVRIPVDYEGAKENYRKLLEEDGLTGGYARLFCDYIGVAAGILPVFVTASRVLRDRRAQMQELIYSRKISSAALTGSRYAALVLMHMLPILLLSIIPYVKCITAGIENVHPDNLAWLKYDLGWLLPTVMIVISVGMLCTELTETAAGVFVQAAWWFISLMTGVTGLSGGNYGWNLIPRHNTEMNYAGFVSGFRQLAENRILYAVLALVLLAVTMVVYERKRKGHLRRRGKICRNRKSAAGI